MLKKYAKKLQGKTMTKEEIFAETMQSRGVSFARIGMRVEINGRMGNIKGCSVRANIDVLFDGDKSKSNCHPTWNICYFHHDGSIAGDFREGKV